MKTITGRFDQALAFAAVAEHGSFTRAAEHLGLSKAHVSEQVAALESTLGVQLLLRTTRRLTLTETGKLYLDYCRQLRDTLIEADQAVSATQSEVSGRIRITAPTSFGDAFLPELVIEFQRRHPDVEIDLDLSIVRRDLLGEGFDLAIRSARTVEERFVARPLGVIRELAVASPALLALHGPIARPADLADVPCVINSHMSNDPHWVFERGGASESVTVSSRFRVNYYSAIKRAALVGAGAVRLPAYLIEGELAAGTLVRVCEGYRLVPTPLWLVWPQTRHQPLRTRVLAEFVLRWFDAPERAHLFR